MENKLQELTQKLYDEGLSKGRQEAETLVSDAKTQAGKIVAEAEKEAESIRKTAQRDAEDLHKNTLTELNLAGKQVINKLKSSIQEMVVEKTTANAVASANMDPKFIEEVLVAVAKNWQGSSADRIELRALLPEEMRAKLDGNFADSVRKALDGGMDIDFSNDVKSGFRIGPKEGGYHISFSDESFEALLSEYLRPKVNELLYGNKE